MAQLSFYDVAIINGNDAFTGLVEDQTVYSPELMTIPIELRAGNMYTTLTRQTLPAAQFRQVNQAITGSSSTYKKLVHEMFFVDTPILVDEAVYQSVDQLTGDVLINEAQGALQSVYNLVGNQTWYGQALDGSNGFVGLRSQLLSNIAQNPTATPVTASNSTTSSTAYLIQLHPQGVSFSMGKMGEIGYKPFERQWVAIHNGPNATGTVAGNFQWVTNISFLLGLQVASANSVFGVTGVSTAAGSTPMTDKLGVQLLANVPLTKRLGLTWYMNRGVQASLQNSRTSINQQPAVGENGIPAVSDTPTKIVGYPIVVTDNISNTENNS